MPQAAKKAPEIKQDRNRTYGALESFPEFLRQFVPPENEFDPSGTWKHTYRIQLFSLLINEVGWLEIERRPERDGIRLNVTAQAAAYNGSQQEKASILCAADKLSSLRTIELESRTADAAGLPIPSLKLGLSGRVRSGSVEWTRAERKRTVSAAGQVVSSWALFDAVQRLKPGGEEALQFTMVDDGDVLKPAQTLTYRGQHHIQVAGGTDLALECWEQIGYGILPAHYWVDSKGRLLVAIIGEKALLYDPDAGKRGFFGKAATRA